MFNVAIGKPALGLRFAIHVKMALIAGTATRRPLRLEQFHLLIRHRAAANLRLSLEHTKSAGKVFFHPSDATEVSCVEQNAPKPSDFFQQFIHFVVQD